MTDGAPRSPGPAASDTAVLAILTVAVCVVGGTMVALGQASWLEGVSFATGAVCVWLTVKESIWNFPVGLVNTAGYSVVFFKARLYGDATLQIIYFTLCLIGWYMWRFGGDQGVGLRVARASRRELGLVALFLALGTAILWKTVNLAGGAAPFWDAATTSISLGAQWLLNRKKVENWILWIVVDAIYVPLYIYRGLNLTAILYAVFLVMAVMGLKSWTRAYESSVS